MNQAIVQIVPLLLWSIAIQLYAVFIGILQIDGLGDPMIAGPANWIIVLSKTSKNDGKVFSGWIQNSRMIQPRVVTRTWSYPFAVPGI